MDYTHKRKIGHFDELAERVIVRVKFNGATGTASYTSTTDTAADTSIMSELSGKTVAELQALCGPSTRFALAESRAVYRNVVSGVNSSILSIPLCTVNKTSIVGGFGVVTANCAGSQLYSVGVPGATSAILGPVAGSSLVIPSGASRVIWNSTYPYDTTTPTAAGVAAARVYYAPDKLVAAGTPINLYISVDVTQLGSGDITFEFFATPFGKESYGVTDGISTMRGSFGEDTRTISPKF